MENIYKDENLIKTIRGGGVVVMPTDTIYGIVGQALNADTVERIYKVRQRAPEKPCIILIGDKNELNKFSINLSPEQENEISKYWSFDKTQDFKPGPVSIIFECSDKSLEYLHRGTESLAFRLPSDQNLQNLLKETGPLIAPSANPEGLTPAKDIKEARSYFSDAVDLYIDGGEISGKASKVIKLHNDGSVSILRL